MAADVAIGVVNGKRAMGNTIVKRLPMHRWEFDLITFIIVCGFYAAVVILHRHHTYPLGDEIAFVPATISDAWTEWLTKGVYEYNLPYGSWSAPEPATVIRPIYNLAYWLAHEACGGLSFHDCFLVYMLFYCATIFCGAYLLYHYAIALGVRKRAAQLASWLFLLSPPVLIGLGEYTLQFDAVAGIFAMAASYSLWRGRTMATLAFLLLGVFTKEIVLTAPLAAALSCWLLERRPAKGFLMLVPLCIWAALYLTVFGWSSLVGHGTQFTSFTRMPLMLVRGMSLWPLGVADRQVLREVATGTASFDSRAFVQCTLLAVNWFLWFTLASILWPLARRGAAVVVGPNAETERPLAHAMIWLFCALAMGVVAAQEQPRYGGWIYPSMLIVGVAWWNAPSLWTAQRRRVMMLASTFLVIAFAYGGWGYLKLGKIPTPVAELHETLLSLGGDSGTVYVVNGPIDVFVTPKLLRQAWLLPFDVRLISNFDGCPRGHGGSFATSDSILRITIPDCATMTFPSVPAETLMPAINGYAHHNDIGDYHFADGRVTGHAIRDPAQPVIDVGRKLTVRLLPNLTAATFIYYDWEVGKYRVMKNGLTIR